MLGLGDIVIPGILIALMLRLDDNVKNNVLRVYLFFFKLKSGSRKYFLTTFFAYIAGLVATIYVMHVWKHAQVRY
jgi:minor histocompatibility antigen H13